MNLLIDIGNSRLKWAIEQAGKIHVNQAIDYRKADFIVDLVAIWQNLPVPEKMVISSVAAKTVKQSVIKLSLQLWPEIIILKPSSTPFAFGVYNAYQQPEKLGIDRWLALVAAHHLYPGYSCIVDCGTAITIDILTTQGYHLGGLISPGLELMKNALLKNTAGLHFTKHAAKTHLATHTTAAISNGSLYAAIGMIEAVIKRLDCPTQLILTGGDAELIAEYLETPVIVEKELIFKGLSLFCQKLE